MTNSERLDDTVMGEGDGTKRLVERWVAVCLWIRLAGKLKVKSDSGDHLGQAFAR